MIKYGSTWNSSKIKSKFEHISCNGWHNQWNQDYYNINHNRWMTLTENGQWENKMNGSMNVLMNQCIKTHGIKNQMDDFEWA